MTATATAAVVTAVLMTGCQGDGASSTGQSSSAPVSSSSTTTPSVTVSTSSTSTATHAPRTAATLRRALLGLKDLPTGFEVDKDSGPDGSDDGRVSSSKAECAALVRLLNADRLPGSTADAAASFSGGPDGPFIDESLDAFASPAGAKAFVAGYRKAVSSCGSVRYSVPGVGSSTLKVRAVSFADLGGDSFAARFSASSGALEGFELIQVAAQTGDVLVGMTCVATEPSDAEAATTDAIDKVESTLGTSHDV